MRRGPASPVGCATPVRQRSDVCGPSPTRRGDPPGPTTPWRSTPGWQQPTAEGNPDDTGGVCQYGGTRRPGRQWVSTPAARRIKKFISVGGRGPRPVPWPWSGSTVTPSARSGLINTPSSASVSASGSGGPWRSRHCLKGDQVSRSGSGLVMIARVGPRTPCNTRPDRRGRQTPAPRRLRACSRATPSAGMGGHPHTPARRTISGAPLRFRMVAGRGRRRGPRWGTYAGRTSRHRRTYGGSRRSGSARGRSIGHCTGR